MGGCQNHGPCFGYPNIWCRIIIGIQKGTIILTTTHIPYPILYPLGSRDLPRRPKGPCKGQILVTFELRRRQQPNYVRLCCMFGRCSFKSLRGAGTGGLGTI